jgi:hypothetical protein
VHFDENKCIEETAIFWSQKTGKAISAEDAREINKNISGYLAVLCEWDKRDRNCLDAIDDSVFANSRTER